MFIEPLGRFDLKNVSTRVAVFKVAGEDGPPSPQLGESTRLRHADGPATAAAGPKSIAVLPFINMSADPGNEYFSDGWAGHLDDPQLRVRRIRAGTDNCTPTGADTRISMRPGLTLGHEIRGVVL